MKVAILTVRSPRHHPHFSKEAPALAAAGHEVVVVGPSRPGDAQAGAQPGHPSISVRDFPAGGGSRLSKLGMIPKLTSIGLRVRADAYQAMELPSLAAAVLIKLLTGRPVTYDCREDYPLALALNTAWWPFRPVIGALAWLLETLLVLACDHVFVVNEPLHDRFERLGRRVDYNVSFPKLDFGNGGHRHPRGDRFRLVFCGAPDRRIAVRETVQALALLRARGIDAEADFFGPLDDPAYAEACRVLARSLEVGDRFRLHGEISFGSVPERLREADAGLALYMPTRYMRIVSHPVKLYEYLAAGLPTVVSDLPSLAARVKECDCGVLVDPTDPASIADGIARLAGDRKLAERFGKSGRRAFLDRYNWELQAATYVDAYARLAPRDEHGPAAGSWRGFWDERSQSVHDPVELVRGEPRERVPNTSRLARDRELALFIGDVHARAFLDVGCGNGIVLDKLQGASVTAGVDVSAGMLRRARERLYSRPGYVLAQADATRLPFRDATFDVVTCLDMLHYLDDESAALAARELLRVTRPQGEIVLQVRSSSSPIGVARRLAGLVRRVLKHPRQLQERYRSPAWYRRSLAGGAELVDQYGYGLTPLALGPAWLARRLVSIEDLSRQRLHLKRVPGMHRFMKFRVRPERPVR